jgi:hypothetical protein
MANRNHESKKFFQGAYKIMSDAAALGYEDVRVYFEGFNPADAPHLSPKDLASRKDKYREQLRYSIQRDALKKGDLEMIERINAFFKADRSRSCKQSKNV